MNKQNNFLFIVILISMTMLMPFAIDIHSSSFLAILRSLHTSISNVQFTIPVYLFGVGVSQFLWGPISDCVGRKPIIMAGMLIFLVGTICCFVANTMFLLLLGRLIQGGGIASAAVSYKAVAADVYGARLHRVMPIVILFFSLAPVISPFLGSYIYAYWGWRSNFAFLFLFAISCLLLYVWKLPETRREKLPLHLKNIALGYYALIKDRVYLGSTICAFLTYSILLSFALIGPFVAEKEFGLTAVAYGWSAMFVGCGYVAGCIFSALLVRKFALNTLIYAGVITFFFITLCLFIVCLFGIAHYGTILFATIALSVAAGITMPNYISTALVISREIAGTGGALVGIILSLGEVALTAIVACFHANTYVDLALTYLVLSALTALVYIFWAKQK